MSGTRKKPATRKQPASSAASEEFGNIVEPWEEAERSTIVNDPDVCPYCENDVDNLDKHLRESKQCRKMEAAEDELAVATKKLQLSQSALAAATKKMQKKTVVDESSFEEWQEVENGSTSIPPREVDMSAKTRFACEWGCTTKTGQPRCFHSAGTLLDHIVERHEDLRVVVETPPNYAGAFTTDGRRLIIQQSPIMDKFGV
jgi:hypothetical protein